MQNLFLTLLAALVIFSQVMNYRGTGASASRPIYWATVTNPTYQGYVKKYRAWQMAKGLEPDKLVIDVNSFGLQKTLVQGVAGVAADIIDAHSEMPYFQEVALIENLDEWPDLAQTVRSNLEAFPWVKGSLIREGHLYGVPTRYHTQMLVLNLGALAKAGIATPTFTPTLDEFETLARTFIKQTPQGGKNRPVYFCAPIPLPALLHASGLSLWNETGTALAPFDARRMALMERYRRWVFVEHLIPSPSEMSSFNVEFTGSSSASFALFHHGQFAATWGGRFVAIYERQMTNLIALGAMMPPHGGYPVVDITYGCLTLYRGSPLKEKALGFLRYATSPDFARAVVESSDALPPFPSTMNDPEMLRPSRWTNEWNFHRRFTEVVQTGRVCPPDESPFLIGVQGPSAISKAFEAYAVNAAGSATAWSNANELVKREIALNLNRRPQWRGRYQELCQQQSEIERRRQQGKAIAPGMIHNPFLKQLEEVLARGAKAP